jgi:uncharacterized membrane protein
MIHDGFIYLGTLMLLAAILVNLPVYLKGKGAQKFFMFAPPIVLLYLGMMLLCTMKMWNLEDTAATYKAVKNPLLYAMLFLMLLRCDLKKIIKLGPKMLIGFFAASLSICTGFIVSYAIFHKMLGPDSWKALGALCGSWLGGSGNMLAVQAVLDVSEESMAYSLVIDSVCAVMYVMFLLWVINFSKEFNAWTKADVRLINEVGASLEEEAKANTKPLTWKSMLLLVGVSFFISAISKDVGSMVANALPVFDSATWTVLLVTAVGLLVAMTPFGKLKGTEEVSNIILYVEIALIASRADISAMGNAPVWLAAGFLILLIHVAVMVILAKVIKMDIFTCAVASLANVGGTATAPVLAGAYSSALVPVGILMALLGNIIGTPGGAFVGHLMSLIG